MKLSVLIISYFKTYNDAILLFQIEETKLLKTQLTVYEEDFKREKSLKESLLEEKNKLDAELEKQVKANDELKQAMQLLQRRETNHRTVSN